MTYYFHFLNGVNFSRMWYCSNEVSQRSTAAKAAVSLVC